MNAKTAKLALDVAGLSLLLTGHVTAVTLLGTAGLSLLLIAVLLALVTR